MSLTSGFFNASNHDRLYDAEAVSRIFDGVISDGVYTSIGECFTVTVSPDIDTSIIIKPGRAWFHHTWTFLDEAMTVELPESDVLLGRIDTVVLKIDSTPSVRQNSIEIKTGTASSNPEPSILTHTEFINEYPLARIRRTAAQDSIDQADITNTVGTSECPFVKGVVETVSTDILLQQWQADFQNWFEHMKDMVDEDLGMRLQQEIDVINDDITTINNEKPYISFITIANNSNLNNITTPGMYRNTSDSNTITNVPVVRTSFYLIVLSLSDNAADVTQIFVPYNSEKVYNRRRISNGAWSAWYAPQKISMVLNGSTLEITS